MATTFAPLRISPASFSTIRSLLSSGIGFFSDGPYRYVAADSDVYRFDVVQRTGAVTWTDAVKALPTAFKAVVNGGYFSGTALYGRATLGVVQPGDVDSDGDVKKGGAIVLPDDGKGSIYFFFGRDGASTPSYTGGRGNPSSAIFEGMGGLGPIILPNPAAATTPLKFGVGNRYKSDPKKISIPTTNAELLDCIQRNNDTYAWLQTHSATGTGYCAVAVVPTTKLLLAVIKPNGTAGDLDTLRDALFSVGCTVACFTDGSSSACLAIDGAMEPGLEPIRVKDNLIETGFGLFLYKPPPPTKVQVDFTQVKVFNDAFAFGAGDWTLNADVNGTPVTLLSAAAVNTGDIIILSFSATVTVASGAELVVTTSGQDTAGLDDDLGTVSDRFGATRSPSFGAGAHTLSTPFYAVSYTITLV
jgi:hypothetical protein